ncbi:MAG: hypothetical protein KDE24_32085 [Caldilinea sp.]|nr:hypothetical protein [Caldilinea sp.]
MRITNEQRAQEAWEELIMIASDSESTHAIVPPAHEPKTIYRIGYEVLTEHPYQFAEAEFQHEVHIERRGRPDLRIEKYSIRRSPLVKRFGWGIHRDANGKLALVACDSEEYQRLLADPNVKKTPGFRTAR